MNYRISKRADADFDEIWNYIAQDNPEAADRVENSLHAAIRLLARMPGMGHRRNDVSNPIYRFWAVGAYVIAYRREGRTIVVVRIIHGARDFRRIFK
jgi:toxin ParE1/3/4